MHQLMPIESRKPPQSDDGGGGDVAATAIEGCKDEKSSHREPMRAVDVFLPWLLWMIPNPIASQRVAIDIVLLWLPWMIPKSRQQLQMVWPKRRTGATPQRLQIDPDRSKERARPAAATPPTPSHRVPTRSSCLYPGVGQLDASMDTAGALTTAATTAMMKPITPIRPSEVRS